MLKRKITYEDYNDPPKTHIEDFYFNLSEAELMELENSREGGLADSLQKLVDEKDLAGLISEFKKLVLVAYGIKSEDGKRFQKSDDIREAFSQHPAYSVLFMELSLDAGLAAEFVNGIMPRGLAELAAKAELEGKVADSLKTQSTADIAAALATPNEG